MRTTNGARIRIENTVEPSASTLTPMMFIRAKTAMMAQHTR
jgi:hypothetical protein